MKKRVSLGVGPMYVIPVLIVQWPITRVVLIGPLGQTDTWSWNDLVSK